jgi:cyclopropane-fatty-acyl-phospholipid synthase
MEWRMLLSRLLQRIIRHGDLTVTDWMGHTRRYGDGTGEPIHIQLASNSVARAIAINPDLKFGETYMDGGLMLRRGSLFNLIELATRSMWYLDADPVQKAVYTARRALRRLNQHNPVGRARENVAHHYDLSGQIYDLFLDVDRQYSCAYFETEDSTLEEAQLAKKRHLAAKLQVRPGMKVLDIGSGWGGLGLYLAEVCGADITGVTLSEEQHKLSNERAQQRGLSGRAKFLLQDYRHIDEKFDRIISVGMFEHVGVGHYPEFFAKCRDLLKEDGVMVLHSINRSGGPGVTNAWLRKYIFPGGYVPALSEVLPHIENNGLYVTDAEILRLHYAKTLRHWAGRFQDNRERAKAIYDERFCRMWEFYLAASECSFRFGGMNNFQIQFCKNQNVLPLTRDYIQQEEIHLKRLEGKQPRLKSVTG